MNYNKVQTNLKKRHRAELRFKTYGIIAIFIAITFLSSLIIGLIYKGASALTKTEILLEINLEENNNYEVVINKSILKLISVKKIKLKNLKKIKNDILNLLSPTASLELYNYIDKDKINIKKNIEVWILASDKVNTILKTTTKNKSFAFQINNQQKIWLEDLIKQGKVRTIINKNLIIGLNSQEPEQAGLYGAIIGSFYTMLISLLFSLPFGIATAIYLEEFTSNNEFYHFIEVNISNLAAVPSIIFGLLGVSIFLNIFSLPRSSSIVGGCTLALIMIPTIIIATRTALKSIPKSIRQAAYGLGASKMQTTFHHVVPLALPGILTGITLSIARTIGESAPLLMIGMVAFIIEPPITPFDSATTIPIQIFSWAKNPEKGFIENTAAAIIILLFILSLISLTAFIIRKRFE